MCGITGVFNFKEKNAVDKNLLVCMTNMLVHRGPDGKGFFIDKNIGLGHRRLSIIDLSQKAKQPMSNEDETVWLVFNGEIYNFRELRLLLEKKGYRFKSDSDTEVVVHAYEEFGENCVNYLRGMFAFAIWDSNKRKVFLARDRLGKKPLFYHHDKNKLVFASEMKALLLYPDVPREISKQSISDYLSYGYVPAPNTIFKGIRKLLPGHTLSVYKDGKRILKKYWDLKYNPTRYAEDYLKARILSELEEATRIRMISDVPLGAFLSGGIDSSAVVAMMSKLSSEPIKTFSIGFEEEDFNELPHARIIAEKYSTDHKEFVVKHDLIGILPKIIWYYNEPYSDSSAFPSYYLAELTRKHVTVALNGDGGDENFAGYDRYAAEAVVKVYNLLKPADKLVKPLLGIIPKPVGTKKFLNRLNRVAFLAACKPEERYTNLLYTFNDSDKNKLLDNSFNCGLKESSRIIKQEFSRCNSGNFLNKTMYVDFKRYLPDDLLVKMDIATMAHSLEARCPFLDHKFVEFTATIPPNMKLKGFSKKFILKKALRQILPKEILSRRKTGFGVPLGKWFKGELKSFSEGILQSKRFISRGYFNQKEIDKILERHKSRKEDNGYKLWNLLCLELWHRVYVDRDGIKMPKTIESLS